jgi:hypothetical protein
MFKTLTKLLNTRKCAELQWLQAVSRRNVCHVERQASTIYRTKNTWNLSERVNELEENSGNKGIEIPAQEHRCAEEGLPI